MEFGGGGANVVGKGFQGEEQESKGFKRSGQSAERRRAGNTKAVAQTPVSFGTPPT